MAHHRFSFEEYVDLVADKGIKLEFLDGQVWAMSGATVEHARVTNNIARLIGNAIQGRPCAVFSPDLRIRAKATGLATYPDVSVVCGKPELDPDDHKGQSVVNPRVLVEVLSPSTEAYDRGEKLRHYQTIPALQEIVFAAHDRREVEVVRREADGSWSRHVFTDVVRLASLDGVELSVADIYRDPLA